MAFPPSRLHAQVKIAGVMISEEAGDAGVQNWGAVQMAMEVRWRALCCERQAGQEKAAGKHQSEIEAAVVSATTGF